MLVMLAFYYRFVFTYFILQVPVGHEYTSSTANLNIVNYGEAIN